ncbi:MAG: hypothetical protein K6D97_01750 [Clostridia bacterium]|nr:hypothetical protein [Clostridia bacterium]
MDILRKYDELVDIIEGNEDSKLLEKSLKVSMGKTTKKQRSSIMSFSGSHRSGELFFDVLNQDNMYCRWKGQRLRGENKINSEYSGYWTIWKGEDVPPRYVTESGVAVPALCGETFGNITYEDARGCSRYIVGKPNFKIVGNRNAMAMEAYILAHSGGKGSHPSAEQIAWWNTDRLGNGNIVSGNASVNDLTMEALTFQNFADKLTTHHARSSNGFNYTVPKWMSGKKEISEGTTRNTYDFDRVSVDYDKDKNEYIVGPFAVNFVRSSYGDVDFGAIESMTLITDKFQNGVSWNSDSNSCGWKIQLENGTICKDLRQIDGKRPFYIIVEYDKNIIDKKILNVKVGIKYMNASGNYDQLVGEYNYREYKMDGIVGWDLYSYMDNCHMKNQRLNLVCDTIDTYNTSKWQFVMAKYEHHKIVKYDDSNIWDLYGPHGECRVIMDTDTSNGSNYLHVPPDEGDDYIFNTFDEYIDSNGYTHTKPNTPNPSTIGEEKYVNMYPTDDEGYPKYKFDLSDVHDSWIENQYPYRIIDPVGEGYDIGIADRTHTHIWPALEPCYIYSQAADAREWVHDFIHDLSSFRWLEADILYPRIAIAYLGEGTETWQSLNAAIRASLWYEHYECSLISTINDSKLTIIKDMEDSNGKPIDESIKFNLSVDNEKTIVKYNDSQMVVNPLNNVSVSSRVYYYQDKGGLGFTLKEEKTDGYEDYVIESVDAKDDAGNTVAVTLSADKTTITGKMPQNGLTLHIKNVDTDKKEKNAKIQIKKKIDITSANYPYTLETDNAKGTITNYHNKDNEFPFRVTLSPGKESSFVYNGEHYVDSAIIDAFVAAHPEISDRSKIHEGDCVFYTSVKSYTEDDDEEKREHRDVPVSWYENTNPPEYHVEELDENAVKAAEAELTRFFDEAIMATIRKSTAATQKDGIINETGVFVSSDDKPYDEFGNERNSNDDDPIEVTAQNNVRDSKYFGNLKIIKTLDLSNFDDAFPEENLEDHNKLLEEYIDKKIEEYTKNNGNKPLFRFEVKVGDQSEEAQIQGSGAQKIYKDGKLTSYKWEWTSADYELSIGNTTPYTVSELTEEGQIATAKELFTKSGNMVVNGTAVVGYEGNGVVPDDFSSFLNRIEKEEVGLEIGKIIDEKTKEKLKKQNLHFVVALDGHFSYYDGDRKVLPYGYHKIRLTKSGDAAISYIELSKVEGSTEELDTTTSENVDSKYITIPVESLTVNSLNTIFANQKIQYFKTDESDLKILIAEETENLDDTINSYAVNGITKNGWTAIGEINKEGNIIKEVFKNEEIGNNSETAILRINKKVRGISNLTDKEKDNLKFKFNIKIAKQNKSTKTWEAVEDRTITLKYNDQYYSANEWNWVDDKITWDSDVYNTPVYMVQEDVSVLPKNIKFEGFNVGGTYETIDRSNESNSEYIKLFGKISEKAEEMFQSSENIYEDYKVNYDGYKTSGILNNLIKRVSLDDHAVIGVMTKKGKSEATDESQNGGNLGIDESVDTVDVYAENSLDDTKPVEGKIKITKTIKSTLDEKKEYAFAVKITSGKFKLGGTEYEIKGSNGLYLTKDNTLVDSNTYFSGEIPNLSKALIIRVDEKSNSIESGVFSWDKGEEPPTYEIEHKEWCREINNDPANTQLYNKEWEVNNKEFSISSKDGTITDNSEKLEGKINSEIINIDVVNSESIPVKIKLYKAYNRREEKDIIESIYGLESDYEKAREQELKNRTFEFDLNIIGVRNYNPILKYNQALSDEAGDDVYVYTAGESDDYMIEVPDASEYQYEIKEKENKGSGLSFKSFTVDGVEDKNPIYRGTLNITNPSASQQVGEFEADIKAENTLTDGTLKSGKLQIYKEVSKNDGAVPLDGTLSFEVKIEASDAVYINGEQIIRLTGNNKYYVKYEDGVETLTQEPTDRVKIPFKGSASETWTMQGKIEWLNENVAPKYTVKEDAGYSPIYENGNQNEYKEGSLSDSDPNGYVKTFIENDTDGGNEFVYLKLEKQFTASNATSNEFKFKIEVEGHATQYVTLRTPDQRSKVFKYKINSSQNYLDYKVTEVEIPRGAKFEYFYENVKDDNHIVNSSHSIAGRLTKENNSTEATALGVVCVNGPGTGGGDDSASLSLKKELLGNSNGSGKEFKFKVKINTENAVEVIGGAIGKSLNPNGVGYIDKNDSKEFEVNVKAGNTVDLGKFKWAGTSEGGPSYVVEEVQDESGNTIKSNSVGTAKKMVKGESYQITQYNEETTYGGYIKVHKEYDSNSIKTQPNTNLEFKFDVFVYDKNPTDSNAKKIYEFKNNKVKAGETWTSEFITWKGDNVPYYYVLEQEHDYVLKENEEQAEGTWEARVAGELVNNKENAKPVPMLYKENTGNQQKVEKQNNEQLTDEEILMNEIIDLGYNYINPDELEARDKVIITNKKDEEDKNKGSFKIIKEVEAEKLGVEDDMPEDGFEIEITVSGQFELDGERYTDKWRRTIHLSHNESFEQELTWDKNSTPPTVSIKEIGLDEINKETKKGVWTLDGISNNGTSLIEDETVTLYVNNKFSRGFARRLLYNIGGNVWEDAAYEGNRNDANSYNGKREAVEEGISKVEVYVYRTVNDELAELYTETGAPIKQPIYTDGYGRWDASLKIEKLNDVVDNSFYVVFVYDGQTYEPTKLLPTGTADQYKAATAQGARDKWKNDSMAIDIKNSQEAKGDIQQKYNRATANEKLHYIQGKFSIDGNGKTTGTAYSNQAGAKKYNLYYTSDIPSDSRDGIGTYSASRVKSTLQTTYDDGRVIDQYKVAASTKSAGLVYPFDKQLVLESANHKKKDYTKGGRTTTYRAGYPYSLHINMGLKRRSEVDLFAAKDLEKATVVVNGRKLTYRFKSLAQRINKPLEIDGYFDDMYTEDQYSTTCYRIGLFKTDYYYRAELYQNNKDYDELYDFYKKLMNYSNGLESTEMEAFLTYKISIYNASPTYDAHVYSINDYSEESLELVTSNVIRYIKNANGTNDVSQIESSVSGNNPKGEVIVDVNNPLGTGTNILSLTALNAANNQVVNIAYGDNKKGSDGYRYNKTTFTFDGSGSDYYSIESGEIKDYYLTYRVKKGNYGNISRAIKLGTKSNIVEISRYSTFNQGTNTIAGKVDRNSAPDNVNIEEYNNESRYEDDTYISRARLQLTTDDYNKTISGKAWEDMKEVNTSEGNALYKSNGNGIYEDGKEALIGGLSTELVEKIVIPSGAKNGNATEEYTEYDFLWPTNESLQVFGGETYESLTGFTSITETARTKVEKDGDVVQSVGEYKFKYIPAGDYVVRFRYGIDKSNTAKSNITTGEPTALNADGKAWATNFNSDKDKVGTYTANYYRKRYGQTPAVYNGQDYKSTIVVENSDNSSKVKDNESRRLEVMSNSEIITNSNGHDMYEANKTDGRHYMIHEFYDMYADSDKNSIYTYNDKNKTANNTKNGTYTYISGSDVKASPESGDSDFESDEDISQTISNINIGLVERPENKIVLDKEISSIKLTSNDDKVLFNAVYDLSYVVKTQQEIDEVSTKDPKATIKIAALKDDKFLVAVSKLNADKSVATDVMQQINKVEKKLEYLENINKGTQNFRYINIDNDILHGLHVEIGYKLVALNIGEIDYTHECIENLSGRKAAADQMLEYAKAIRRENAKYKKNGASIEPDGLAYGDRNTQYIDPTQKDSSQNEVTGDIGIGTYYYTGDPGPDGSHNVPVSSRVRVVMDYVDNDAVFDSEFNREKDHYWKSVSVKELDGGGTPVNRLIDGSVSNGLYILDKDDRKYIIESHRNIAMNIDTVNDTNDTEGTNNAGFEMRLLPYTFKGIDGIIANNKNTLPMNVIMDKNALEEEINLEGSNEELFKVASVLDVTVIKNTSAQTDADSMSYDNLAEILKYENSVGRRDMTVVPGNTNPKYGEFYISLDERDASATELITFTPPTGTYYKDVINNQLIIAITSGLAIVVLGIIIIKKKVIDVDAKSVSNSNKNKNTKK